MADLSTFFTEAFEKFTDKEEFYKAVIMNMYGDEALQARNEYYRRCFKSCGENVNIGVGVQIVGAENISVGDNVSICDDVTIRASGSITIGSGVTITQRVYLDTEGEEGYINIGNNVYIGTGTSLFGHCGLEIGDHSLLAQNISLTPYSHIFEDPDRLIINQGGHTKKVTIGRDCYIGMNVTILYSADIGDGSVVGSGTVVVKPIPPYSVAVGNPARIIRKRGEAKK